MTQIFCNDSCEMLIWREWHQKHFYVYSARWLATNWPKGNVKLPFYMIWEPLVTSSYQSLHHLETFCATWVMQDGDIVKLPWQHSKRADTEDLWNYRLLFLKIGTPFPFKPARLHRTHVLNPLRDTCTYFLVAECVCNDTRKTKLFFLHEMEGILSNVSVYKTGVF